MDGTLAFPNCAASTHPFLNNLIGLYRPDIIELNNLKTKAMNKENKSGYALMWSFVWTAIMYAMYTFYWLTPDISVWTEGARASFLLMWFIGEFALIGSIVASDN